ncbi:hypothetical protein BS50DRAFT_646081 [Corynespora cassiicola Philippines]|uniref:F-box domain-containing protein n=1 Tax=Corynespora cassiicola Philippines TaxID=1448308 RepID=A0A2T2MZK1_CORCC|nr:hypothetical protein BS50DRAFT_646081 [Corynespora cassiicola Philippines]
MIDNNTSTNRSLGLPTELWVAILRLLVLEDRKRFRLANHECRDIVTPLCFETVTFEMSEASVRNLICVASNQRLAPHARILVLKRGKRMRKYHNRDEWEQSVSLPDDPNITLNPFEEEDSEFHAHDEIMSYSDWLNHSDERRESLYQQYEAERSVHPATATSSVAEQYSIAKLDEALANFTRLTTFIHKPTVPFRDLWITHWKRLRLNTYYDIGTESYDEDCQEDNDFEALHLSYALRAIGWAKPSLVSLTSIIFHVEGPAFWGPRRLRSLWNGEGHSEIIKLREPYGNAEQVDMEWLGFWSNDGRNEKYTRQLIIMKNAIRELTHIGCSVSEDENNWGLFTAARSLFEFFAVVKT